MRIQPLQACATLILFANQNSFRITCERIHQSSRVGGDDELRTLTGKFDGICVFPPTVRAALYLKFFGQIGIQTSSVESNQRIINGGIGKALGIKSI